MTKTHQVDLMGKLKEKDLKDYAAFFESNALEKFEIEEQGVRVKLERGNSNPLPSLGTSVPPAEIASQNTPPPSPAKTADSEIEKEIKSTDLEEIKSPIMGTFYSSPSPDAPPFVTVGKVVAANDVVAIVEAMKMMNEIKAEVSGKIAEILINNGDMVSADQVIMRVE